MYWNNRLLQSINMYTSSREDTRFFQWKNAFVLEVKEEFLLLSSSIEVL